MRTFTSLKRAFSLSPLFVSILFLFGLVGAFLSLPAHSALASVCTFNASDDNTFSDADNWDDCGGVAPLAADSIVVPDGLTVDLVADTVVTNMYVTGTVSITDWALTATGVTLVDAAGVIDSDSGKFTFGGAVSSTGSIAGTTGDFLFSSSFQNNGYFDLGSGTATSTGYTTSTGTIYGRSGTLVFLKSYVNEGGVFQHGSSIVKYRGSDTDGRDTVPNVTFNTLRLEVSGDGHQVTLPSTLVVLAGMYTSGPGFVIGALGGTDLDVTGDLILTGSFFVDNSHVTTTGDFIFSGFYYGTGASHFSIGGNMTFGGYSMSLGSTVYEVTGNFTNTAVTLTPETSTIVFKGGGTQTTDPMIFYNLFVQKTGGSTVTLSSSSTVLGALTMNGDGVFILDGVSLTVLGATNVGLSDHLSSIAGGHVHFQAPVSSTGEISTVLGGGYRFESTFQNDGVFSVGGGTVISLGSITNTGTMSAGSSLWVWGGDFTNTGSFDPGTGRIRFGGGANQYVNGGIVLYNVDFYNSGAIAIFTASSTVMGTLTLADTNAMVSSEGNDLTVLGLVTVDATNTIFSSTGKLSFLGAVSSTGSIVSDSGDMLFNAGFQNNGTFAIGSGTATSTEMVTSTGVIQGGSGTLVLLRDLVNTGTFDAGTGIVKYRGNTDTYNPTTSNVVYHDLALEITGAGWVDWAASSTVTGNLTIASGVTFINFTGGGLTVVGNIVNDNGTFNLGSGFATTTGDFINGGQFYGGGGGGNFALAGDLTSSGPFRPQTGIFKFIGSSPQTADGVVYNDLVVEKGGSSTVSFSASSTIVGALDLRGTAGGLVGASSVTAVVGATTISASNSFDVGSYASLQGTVTNAGVINGNSGVLIFKGDFVNTGTFSPGSGTVRFSTSGSPQSATGVVFNNLETSADADVTLSSSTVLGTLSLISSGSSLRFGASALHVLGGTTIAVTNVVTSTAGSLIFVGAVSSTGAIGTNTGNMSFGSTVQNNGTLNLGLGAIATSTGALTNAGTLNANNATLVLGSTFFSTGTFNRGTSTVRFTNSSATPIAGLEYYNVQVAGAATYALIASTTVAGTLTIASPSSLAVGTRTLNIPGVLTNNGTIIISSGQIRHPIEALTVTDATGVTTVTSISTDGSLYVTVHDQSRNLLGATIETINVPFTTDVAAGSDEESLTLTETAASSGIFRNTSAVSVRNATVAASNGFVDLSAYGIGTASYTDVYDTADTSSTGVTLAFVAPVVSSGGGGGGGGGGAIGGSSSGTVQPIANVTPVTSSTVAAPATTPIVSSTTQLPTSPNATNPVPPLPISPASARVTALVQTDAQAFGVVLTADDLIRLASFVEFGSSFETIRLGEGERRATLRDAFQTMGRAPATEDLDRLAQGLIPKMRNLTLEKAQLQRVRATFQTIYGNRPPNFQNAAENTVWNTLMYRIRFPRDLKAEQAGIKQFKVLFGRNPSDPFQWATVRALGYIKK